MLNRKKIAKNILGDNILLVLGLVIAGIFLLLDTFNIVKPLRSGISFIFNPIYVDGKNIGSGAKEYFTTIGKVGDFRKEFNELKISSYEKDINNAHYQVLLEENSSLKKQLSLGNKEKKYLLSKVLGIENISNMQIDKGSKEGVEKGSVVSVGNMFVGIVQSVDREGSLVLLPYSKSNSFEVFVTDVGVKEGKVVDGVSILSKAVLRGSGDDINIENISMNSAVKDGDIVVTMDERVGGYLIVGQIANLVSNPAATSKSAKVAPLVDYDDLMSVFVEIE